MNYSQNLTKLWTTLLTALLSVLGFAGCSDTKDEPLMYGTPTGSFEIKGIVTDEANQPVENARIEVGHYYKDSTWHPMATPVTTGANGSYTVTEGGFDYTSVTVMCIPPDDTLETATKEVSLVYQGGDGAWDRGHATATVDFQLKAAPTPAE